MRGLRKMKSLPELGIEPGTPGTRPSTLIIKLSLHPIYPVTFITDPLIPATQTWYHAVYSRENAAFIAQKIQNIPVDLYMVLLPNTYMYIDTYFYLGGMDRMLYYKPQNHQTCNILSKLNCGLEHYSFLLCKPFGALETIWTSNPAQTKLYRTSKSYFREISFPKADYSQSQVPVVLYDCFVLLVKTCIWTKIEFGCFFPWNLPRLLREPLKTCLPNWEFLLMDGDDSITYLILDW